MKLLGCLAVLAVAGCSAEPIVDGDVGFETAPYLGHTTTETSTIRWVSRQPYEGRVAFGTADGELSRTANEDTERTVHEVRLTDLAPATQYRYRVERPRDEPSEGLFWTAPRREDAFSFVVIGDTRTGHEVHHSMVHAISDLDPQPRFVFNLGDIVEDGRSTDEWKTFFTIIDDLGRSTPYYSTIGNHEKDAANYFDLFTLPSNGSPPEHNYSFDYGGVHVTVLDSNHRYRGTSDQLEWLERDLEHAQAAAFRVVAFHHSGHGTRPQRDKDHAVVREVYDDLLSAGNVDLVFNGHDHNYVRAKDDEVTYVVCGGGGAPLHEIGPSTPDTRAQSKHYHFCLVRVTPDKLAVTAITRDGRVLDAFEIAAGV